MNCMKCGRETGPDAAFCDACLEEMATRPVNPAAVVLLPEQVKYTPKKASPKKPQLTADELITVLRRKVRNLRILVLILILLLGGVATIARIALTELDFQRLLGQNYSTIQQTEAPAE